MALPLLILLLLAVAQTQQQYCTRTPYDWQALWCDSNATVRQSYTLCGADWCALLAVEPDGMILSENRAWMLSARQYVAASLNRLRLQWHTPDAVNASLLFLGDALEAQCASLSQWRLSAALSDAQWTLYAFNHDSTTVCAPVAPAQLPVDTFYYTRAPDVLVMRRDAGDNATQLSTLNAAYSTNVTLLTCTVVLLLLCAVMGLKLVADRSASRHFAWCRRNGAMNEEEDDHTQMLEVMNLPDELSTTSEEEKKSTKRD